MKKLSRINGKTQEKYARHSEALKATAAKRGVTMQKLVIEAVNETLGK